MSQAQNLFNTQLEIDIFFSRIRIPDPHVAKVRQPTVDEVFQFFQSAQAKLPSFDLRYDIVHGHNFSS